MNDFLLDQYAGILNEFGNKFKKTLSVKDEQRSIRATIFSANLTNFMPDVLPERHQAMFDALELNAAYENFDWNVTNLHELTDLQGNVEVLDNPSKPVIFCTFHLGSYRLIARHLADANFNHSVLVRGGIHLAHKESFMEAAAESNKAKNLNVDFRVHDAESPDVLLKVVRELKEGRSLLLYLDGNTGTGNEKLDEVSFLGQQILVKKGLGYLSYLSGVPIVPVISYRKPNQQNVLHFGEVIVPDKNLSREEFSQKTIQHVFTYFSGFVRQYPEQWEAWAYVQKFLKPVEEAEESVIVAKKKDYIFNHFRYSLLDLSESPILFDKKQYNTFEISYDLLKFLSKPAFKHPQRILGMGVFNELVMRQVLV